MHRRQGHLIADVHAARDAFRTHLSRIASVCALLRQVPLPADDEPGWTPVANAWRASGNAGGSSSTSPPGG
ncbi:hypothetical protein [Streptomyces chrestomyceticus]|uniref:hypothetical protein n=1 Tax=Streptomyces chrestomyceticus TaxID=68185 RepID=UPI0037A42715